MVPKAAPDLSRHPVGHHGRETLTLSIDELLRGWLDWVTFDPMQPPYDSLRMYEYEGAESEAASLSSIESLDDGGMQDDVFKEWEPKFQTLLEVLSGAELKTDGEENRVLTDDRVREEEQ